jgi:hypothetical protein
MRLVCRGLLFVSLISTAPVAQAQTPFGQPAVPPQLTNRPPYAPTVIQPPNAWAPALSPTAVLLSWQHNGDPDNNPVRFFLTLYQYSGASRQWILVFQSWVTTGTSLLVQSLQFSSYYSWQVYAFDGALWSPPSAPAVFATRAFP